ncbi:hypothetical protein SPONL_1636 [uncultured Candidatus Thioglobus sp.]|nr:hypothetical protein SPONL_1636 [uncultured Candidatus Thioglobus sp.]
MEHNINTFADKLINKEFREKLLGDNPGLSLLSDFGYTFDEGQEVKVIASTKEVTYIVMPDDAELELDKVAAGMSIGAGTAGSVGTLCSSLSSASTAGTAINL